MVTGNAAIDGKDTRGWFVGQFIDGSSPLHSDEVEVKWSFEPAGTTKAGAGVNKISKTLTILVSGEFAVNVDGEKVVLKTPGDYVFFGAGESHSWHAVTDSTVLSVRWPSIVDDQTTTVN